MIPFNKPYLSGKETHYIYKAVQMLKLSGNGEYTKTCQSFFEDKYDFGKCLLTTSCTDALEMAAILADIKPGDEVIIPSYTFVSSALAFVRQGANIVFADSKPTHPNIDESKLESLITEKTKAIVVVHYSGTACEMDSIMALANKHNIFVIEDAAQAIDNYYINSKGEQKALGSIGHFSTFSFHETKNIISGEGGMLVVNDDRFKARAEVIWEKGTNRAEFFRGEVNKYGWVDTGSSFLPSEIISAFLWAQLESLDDIQSKRCSIWDTYKNGLQDIENQNLVKLQHIETHSTNNAHMFYLICNSIEERSALISHLKSNDIHAVFHYLSLHQSPFYLKQNLPKVDLPHSDRFENTLLRLPFYYELSDEQQQHIIQTINAFYTK
ncbi:MAG: dTDP-4-amino-4,6-dideoxygalactose transaminase [Flavobacteriales bacterium]